jgi:FixJ family two-component response regulator
VTELAATVIVVDDDASVRRGLERLLRAVGYRAETYGSADEFLARPPIAGPCCLVLDVRMPGKGGLDLYQELVTRGEHVPAVFITGYGDIATVVRAMKAGAVDFLAKPFDDRQLLDAVDQALNGKRRSS